VLSQLLWAASCWQLTGGAGYIDHNTYSAKGEVQRVRRERNLDHWDSDTLAFYLDEYPGFDIAIMFYAAWDGNSRALAPYWDRIATKMDAGNSNSRLVMALFDCELNMAHAELCHAAGITHYPTLMFIGSGPYHDADPFSRAIFGKRAGGMFGPAPLPNTVKFQGNWQYTDSIADWIRTMQALSNWHLWSTKGFGKKLRSFFLPSKPVKTDLPVGIPGRSGAATGAGLGAASSLGAGGSGGGGGDESMRVQSLEKQVKQLTDHTEQYEKAVTMVSSRLDNMLTGKYKSKDMFQLLHEQNAWAESAEAIGYVLKTCVAELSVDYCQRISQEAANDMVDELSKQGVGVEEMLAMPDLEQMILGRVGSQEPYCALLDDCIVNDFASPECRPQECPFTNSAACQYLTTCLDPEVQTYYAEALGYSVEDGKASA